MSEPLWGKYVGIVRDNVDPDGRGRLRLAFPALDLGVSDWAPVSLSAHEARHVDEFVPPPIGSAVWVEFERGDEQHPVWTGCCWPA